jgi:1,4-dihydroxy-2-naphthoate octaprenyltransferase
MSRTPRDRIEPVVLIVIAVALFVAAFLSYTGHPVRDSNLYSPHAPGWIAVLLFFLIGIVGRLIYIHDQRRAAKRKRDASPKI